MGDQRHIVMCLSVLGVVVGIPCPSSLLPLSLIIEWVSAPTEVSLHYVTCVISESAFIDEAKQLVRAEVGPPRTTIRRNRGD